MESDESRRERIAACAAQKMMAQGVSGVTMEEIARGVGMGKATVYRLFPSKEALALAAVEGQSARLTEKAGAAAADPSLSDAEKLAAFLTLLSGLLRQIRPEALEDILRTMPTVGEKIEQTRRRFMLGSLLRLLGDGKKSGLFAPELDENLAAHMLIGAVAHLTEPEVFASLHRTPESLFTDVIGLLMHGCLSEEGRRDKQPEN